MKIKIGQGGKKNMALFDMFRKDKKGTLDFTTPEYKGSSFIPSKIQVVAEKDGEPVFTETINIW